MSERTRIRMSTPKAKKRARETASRPRPNARGANPNKARWGNQNVLGKRWSLTPERRAQLSRHGHGRTPSKHCGIGKTGYRADIGHFVRSTWEANFARILKHLGVSYEFEKTTVRFPDGRAYRPDFWMPGLQCHIEIKGYETTESKRKHRQTLQQGIPVFIIDGSRYRILEQKYANLIPEWESS